MPPRRGCARVAREAKSPTHQPEAAPQPVFLDMVGAFLEALRGLPLQQQDPATRCQVQLTAFVRAWAPEFIGYQGPLAADRWLRSIKMIFCTLETPVEFEVLFTAHRFTGVTITWWETLGYTYDTQGITWEIFESLFREAYFNPHHRRAITDEFEALYQGDMMVKE